jgi:hypothetical protein
LDEALDGNVFVPLSLILDISFFIIHGAEAMPLIIDPLTHILGPIPIIHGAMASLITVHKIAVILGPTIIRCENLNPLSFPAVVLPLTLVHSPIVSNPPPLAFTIAITPVPFIIVALPIKILIKPGAPPMLDLAIRAELPKIHRTIGFRVQFFSLFRPNLRLKVLLIVGERPG